MFVVYGAGCLPPVPAGRIYRQGSAWCKKAARGQVGRLAIGFIGPAVYSIVPEILRLYRERFPGQNLDALNNTLRHRIVVVNMLT